MYISKEQLDSRLKGQNNLELRGRNGIGKKPVLPRETKVLAGVLAKFDTQKNVAETLGTSQANVSNIVRNDELRDDIDKVAKPTNEQVSSKAVDILLRSLNVVDKKLEKEGAMNASSIARNLATVANKFTPNQGGAFAPRILINIHGSKQRDESDFETIEVESVSA